MYSYSKITLSPDAICAIAAHYFGSSAQLKHYEELKEGLFNTAALLELVDGTRLVLKAAPPDGVRVMRYEKDLMAAEVGAMRRVRAESDVPVPNILVYDTSRQLLPSDFFIMEFLPGVAFHHLRGQLTAEEQARVDAEMGRLTRQIGTIHGPVFGYWAQPERPGVSWRECFARMVEGVLQDGLDLNVDLHLPYEQIRARVQRHLGVLDEIATPQLVHWDLWDGNIFVDPQTQRITGLIDFERALWGDPLIEGIFINIDPASSAAQGYGAELLATPQRRMRRLLYNVYLHLIMVVECYFRHYQTQDQENWIRPILDQELSELEQKTSLS